MVDSRYTYTPKVSTNIVGNSNSSYLILQAVQAGTLPCTYVEVKDGIRLDHIAANAYGDARYWWVIAAASGIGWGLQVPPGTIARIPSSIASVMQVISNVR